MPLQQIIQHPHLTWWRNSPQASWLGLWFIHIHYSVQGCSRSGLRNTGCKVGIQQGWCTRACFVRGNYRAQRKPRWTWREHVKLHADNNPSSGLNCGSKSFNEAMLHLFIYYSPNNEPDTLKNEFICLLDACPKWLIMNQNIITLSGIVVEHVVLLTNSSRVTSSIVSLGYCLLGVSCFPCVRVGYL